MSQTFDVPAPEVADIALAICGHCATRQDLTRKKLPRIDCPCCRRRFDQNSHRAERLDNAIAAYRKSMLEAGMESPELDVFGIGCMLADLHHWCDFNGIDFQAAMDLAASHHCEEADYPDV